MPADCTQGYSVLTQLSSPVVAETSNKNCANLNDVVFLIIRNVALVVYSHGKR